MPPTQKNKRVTVTDLFGGLDELMRSAVTHEEMKEVLDTVARYIKQMQGLVEEKTAENKAEMDTAIGELREKITNSETQLQSNLSEAEQRSIASALSSVEQLRNEVKQSLETVQSMIPPETDLSELYEKLTEHEGKMEEVSMLQKAENIRNALELLEGDDRLKASAIDGLEDLIFQVGKGNFALQGAGMTPSPVHYPRHESFTMNGSDTSVTLAQGVGADGTAIFAVRYNGQVLDIDNQFTVNGNKISLNFTPIADSTISVSYMG